MKLISLLEKEYMYILILALLFNYIYNMYSIGSTHSHWVWHWLCWI